MRYNQAKDLAIRLGERLKPFTSRINIAGSVRRQKYEVKDIELICLPRYIDMIHSDLFGAKTVERVISENFIATVKALGKVIKGKPDGRYMQIELRERINLDLFMPEPDDYYRQYAIRTGSADYAQRTIAAAWKRKGWCGSNLGLRKQSDCIFSETPDGKGKWTCLNNSSERPPVWQSEQEFFEWLGVNWIIPKLRTI